MKFLKRNYLLILLTALFFSRLLSFNVIRSGLDPSWVYALNYFSPFAHGWNSEIIFTYGPLGFLVETLYVGRNMTAAIFIWGILSFIMALTFVNFISMYPTKQKVISIVLMLLLLLFFSLSSDYIIVCMALLFICFMIFKNWKYVFPVSILLYISFFLKFTMIIALLPALLVAFSLMLLKRQYKELLCCIITLCFLFFILFGSGYLISSDFNIFQYMYNSIEVSKGYNIAMSLMTQYDYWVVPLLYVIFLSCFVLTAFLFFINRHLFTVFMVFLFPMFTTLKHAVVRSDGHVFIFYNFLYWSIVLIWILIVLCQKEMHISKKLKLFVGSCFIVMSFSCAIIYLRIPIAFQLKHFNLLQARQKLEKQDLTKLASLPSAFIDKIASSSVTVYPWNIVLTVPYKLNYKAYPALQIYNNYTPYIDKKTSNFFRNKKAKYIIFQRQSIDGRWNLIENPQTWKTIKENYRPTLQEGGLLLLKAREQQEDGFKNKICEKGQHFKINKNEKILLLDYPNSCLSVKANLSFWGKIVLIFWKIPPVNLNVEYEDGSHMEKRVLLDNLKSDFCVNDFGQKVKSIQLTAAGLSFYEDEIQIDLEDCTTNLD